MAWASAHLVYAAANSNPTAIATALIALGGALLGAVLSTGTQLLIAHRQARRDTAARSKEIMIAARMMAVDLSRARSNIQYWIDHQSGGGPPACRHASQSMTVASFSASSVRAASTTSIALRALSTTGTALKSMSSPRTGVTAAPRSPLSSTSYARSSGGSTKPGETLRELTGDPASIAGYQPERTNIWSPIDGLFGRRAG